MRVIIFDGVCNLCNKFVYIVLKRDKKNLFKFSAIGSNYSRGIEDTFKINLVDLDTVVLIENEKYFSKSTAVIKIARHLGFPYNILPVFYILPKFFRNILYDFMARYRYKIFGKKETCMIPEPSVEKRFIF